MAGMLARLAAAQAGDLEFASGRTGLSPANAAHELRTPLTAMRADLDTLRIHDLPADEREEVVGDLARGPAPGGSHRHPPSGSSRRDSSRRLRNAN